LIVLIVNVAILYTTSLYICQILSAVLAKAQSSTASTSTRFVSSLNSSRYVDYLLVWRRLRLDRLSAPLKDLPTASPLSAGLSLIVI